MTGDLIKRENLDTRTKGECTVKIGFMLPQPKQLAEARREAWDSTTSVLSERHGPAGTFTWT